MERRRCLDAAATPPALPTPDPATETDRDDAAEHEAPSDTDEKEGEDPLAGLHSSVHAQGTFDDSIELDPRPGRRWTGEQWVPVVDLYVRFGIGDICMTLEKEAGQALIEQLREAFGEAE